MLFAHLLQNQPILEKIVAEMDSKLPLPGTSTQKIHVIDGLEQSLPYTMACIQENFRMNAVFSMPLPRKVTSPSGVEIEGRMIPKNVSLSHKLGTYKSALC